jgi:hypothetical protein
MQYLVPFSILKNSIKMVSVRGQLRVDMGYETLLEIIRKLLEAAPVDEDWYRATYPDVTDAIAAGTYRNAKQHFIENGYVEGRRPFPMAVDEAWYLEAYPDLKAGIEQGLINSAAEHFNQHGYIEGRLPSAP